MHGFCGVWGILATAIFAQADLMEAAGYSSVVVNSGAGLFLRQLIGVSVIVIWSVITTIFSFALMECCNSFKDFKNQELQMYYF